MESRERELTLSGVWTKMGLDQSGCKGWTKNLWNQAKVDGCPECPWMPGPRSTVRSSDALPAVCGVVGTCSGLLTRRSGAGTKEWPVGRKVDKKGIERGKRVAKNEFKLGEQGMGYYRPSVDFEGAAFPESLAEDVDQIHSVSSARVAHTACHTYGPGTTMHSSRSIIA